MKRILLSALILPGALFFVSCSGRIDGVLREDGSAELILEAALEPRMTGLLRTLSQAMGGPGLTGDTLILDGPAIGQSMAAAPGISSASLRNQSPTALAGTIGISQIDAFLAYPGSRGGGFIRYEKSGSLVISLDRNSGPRLLSLFSGEVNDYLSSLMAPVSTGENVPRAEYLALVTSIYGRPVSDEIAAARILVSLEFPRPITRVRGGTYQGRRAQFDLPLLDFLVLDRPLVYEVSW